MKISFLHSIIFFLVGSLLGFSQQIGGTAKFVLKGSIKERSNDNPIPNVTVSSSGGEISFTDVLGAFKIKTAIGEELIFEDVSFETVRYRVNSTEDVLILVEDYEQSSSVYSSRSQENRPMAHQSLLDSAEYYKRKDIKKSIDFVASSISQLGKIGNKKELARSLSKLGEIYLYHKQLDLAIDNFEDALEVNKTIATTLLLGRAYMLSKRPQKTIDVLTAVSKVKNMVPYQNVEVFEYLGDAHKALNEINEALSFYNRGLTIATKNQITPKMTDLNSKIADTYSKANQLIEAEAYYDNSMQLANTLAPQRALQEKEKVADFYNKKSQFSEEIVMRKNSLEELKKLNTSEAGLQTDLGDTITSQRINYKIANAYIAQDKYNEAIPYLEKSIVEADSEDDLVVQKDATRKLSEVYKVKGDFSKALSSYQEYVTLVDTLYIRKEQEIARAARFNRQIAETQSRITGLEQERELSQSKYDLALTEQELVKESNKRQQWLIYSLFGGLFLTLLAVFFFYRSNQQQKLANNLLALKSLRSQMNPHFIFNALNSVNNFIAKNDERSANRYLTNFSTLMRAVLENSEEDFIPLKKEIEQLELYMQLEHSRFPEKFEYSIVIDSNVALEEYQIPPMLLQPYIENAIWHGLRYKDEKGFLTVSINKKSEKEIVIGIEDNGIGRKKSIAIKTSHQKKQKSKGMGIIQKRVAILNDMYKDKVDIVISDLYTDGSGTKVLFMLKKDI